MAYKVKAVWFIALAKKLTFYTHRGELERVCKDLKIDFEEIKGQKIDIQAQEIIGVMIFRNEVDKLINYLKKNKPSWQPRDYHLLDLDDIQKHAGIALRIADPLREVVYSGPPVLVPPKGAIKPWYHELAAALENYYDDDEFREMCRYFRMETTLLESASRKARALKIVEHGLNFGLIGKIVKYCRQNRPRVQPCKNHQVPWETFELRAREAVQTGNPLNDPLATIKAYFTYSA